MVYLCSEVGCLAVWFGGLNGLGVVLVVCGLDDWFGWFVGYCSGLAGG